MKIVPTALVLVPSLTVNARLSVPVKSLFGVYTRSGKFPDTLPLDGRSNSKNSRLSLSASAPVKRIASGTFARVTKD